MGLVYLPTFGYGFHVGKYSTPMDPSWVFLHPKNPNGQLRRGRAR